MKESDNSLNQVNKPEQSTGLSEIFDHTLLQQDN